MTHVVLVVIDQYLTGCRTACHMLVHAHKPVNTTNVPAQSGVLAQSAQSDVSGVSATNKPFYVTVEYACSSKAVTTLLIDTTDEHGDQTVRHQIAQAVAHTPGFETSLVAQNKMTLFINHNGMTLGQHNFYMIKPGDTLVVTGNSVCDIVDQMYQHSTNKYFYTSQTDFEQAMSSLGELGAQVFDMRCKLLACVQKLSYVTCVPTQVKIGDFACATLAWLCNQQLYLKKQACHSVYIKHIIKATRNWDALHLVGLVNLALDVVDPGFSKCLATDLSCWNHDAAEAALDVALANVQHDASHASCAYGAVYRDDDDEVWCTTRKHVAAMLVSRLGYDYWYNYWPFPLKHAQMCLACLRQCSSYTAKCLFSVLDQGTGVLRLSDVDCNDVLNVCVAHASGWPGGAPRMYVNIGTIVKRIMTHQRCSWAQLVASGFLEKNTLPNVAHADRGRTCVVEKLIRMISKCCDNWSTELCSQLVNVLGIVVHWKHMSMPMSELLGLFENYDKDMLVEHHSAIAGAFGVASQTLVVKLHFRAYVNMTFQFCKLIHKLDIKDGEPGRQGMCRVCGAFQQACKQLKSKHAFAKIWAGKLAKQYCQSEQPVEPTPSQTSQTGPTGLASLPTSPCKRKHVTITT